MRLFQIIVCLIVLLMAAGAIDARVLYARKPNSTTEKHVQKGQLFTAPLKPCSSGMFRDRRGQCRKKV